MFNEGVITYFSAHCCMSINLFHGIRVLWFSSHPVTKKFTAFYGNETFITIFLNSLLSHENSIHIVPISLWFILITSSALNLSVQTFNLELISSGWGDKNGCGHIEKQRWPLCYSFILCTSHKDHQTEFFKVVFESVKGAVKAVSLCGRVMLR